MRTCVCFQRTREFWSDITDDVSEVDARAEVSFASKKEQRRMGGVLADSEFVLAGLL